MRKITETRFLVTGAAGFIGSNLVGYLLNNGAKHVVGLDNLSTGFIKNIEPFLQHPNFKFIQGDIRSLETCKQACLGIDCISHQAALGSVPRSIADPVTTNEVNVSGFLNMLIAARDCDVKRFVYASSSSVYGDSHLLPKKEEHIGNPLSPYAVTKYTNELYAHVFGLNFGLETIGLRYFNVFGPKQNPKGPYAAVIPLFIDAISKNQSPIIKGDGEQTRDFTYIDNVVESNMNAMLTLHNQALNQVYNIAVGDRTSVNGLLAMLNLIIKKEIKPVFAERPQSDVLDSLADISKAKQLLYYQPKIGIHEGLVKTVDWFMSQ